MTNATLSTSSTRRHFPTDAYAVKSNQLTPVQYRLLSYSFLLSSSEH